MIKVNVEIDNKSWFKQIKDPQNYFRKKVKKIPKILTFLKNKKVIFSILLSKSSKLKKLNKKFRNKNKPTDVLSFPFLDKRKLKFFKKKIYLGDIAVSYEIINSRSKKKNFLFEFDKVWVHGLLHLVGYNHIKKKDYFKMHKFEKRILNLI